MTNTQSPARTVTVIKYIWINGEDSGMKGFYETRTRGDEASIEFLKMIAADLIEAGDVSADVTQDEILNIVTILDRYEDTSSNWVGV